jgi:hypothetical protein
MRCLQRFGEENMTKESACVSISGYHSDREPDISAFVGLKTNVFEKISP